MPEPQDPQYSIGPYYQILGGIVLLGSLGLLGLKVERNGVLSWVDLAVFGVLFFAGLALVRPKVFEEAFKALVKGLPWTKYEGGR